ncbi:MAG: TonB family protein [Bacteroidota bacterium]
MKKFLFLLLITAQAPLWAQDTLFLDQQGQEVSGKKAQYARSFKQEGNMLYTQTFAMPERRLMYASTYTGAKRQIRKKNLGLLDVLSVKTYHPDGALQSEYAYDGNALSVPQWKMWDQEGKLKAEVVEVKGQAEEENKSYLVRRWYDEEGQTIREDIYAKSMRGYRWQESVPWKDGKRVEKAQQGAGTGTESEEAPEKETSSGFQEVVEDPEPVNISFMLQSIGYPLKAREGLIEGMVVYRILIDESGRPDYFYLVNSVHPLLDFPIMAYLPQIQFKPALDSEGEGVKFWVNIPFNFKTL